MARLLGLIALLLLLAAPRAEAQTFYQTPSNAYAGCMAAGAAAQSALSNPSQAASNYRCTIEAGSTPQAGGYYCEVYYDSLGGGGTYAGWNGCHNGGQDAYHRWTEACPDGAMPGPTGCPQPESVCEAAGAGEYPTWITFSGWPPPTIGCSPFSQGGEEDNCNTLVDPLSVPIANADGTFSMYAQITYTGSPCSPEEEEEDPINEEPQEDAGDGWKCNPANGLCTDPNGNGKLCTFNPDGSRSACVDYKPGDGTGPQPETPETPDDPRENRSAGGGASCDAPPQCSGDSIDCAQLWQQWKTRCAVEQGTKAAITGGACVNGVPTTLNCTAMSAAECFQAQKLAETACFLSVSGSPDGTELPRGDGSELDQSLGGEPAQGGDAWAGGEVGGGPWGEGGAGELDDSGWLGGGRTCPTLPPVSVFGRTIAFDISPFCDFLAIGAALVLVMAGIASIRIIAGGV